MFLNCSSAFLFPACAVGVAAALCGAFDCAFAPIQYPPTASATATPASNIHFLGIASPSWLKSSRLKPVLIGTRTSLTNHRRNLIPPELLPDSQRSISHKRPAFRKRPPSPAGDSESPSNLLKRPKQK